jgi:LuxR family maltose regulon positive regulatory protein
MRARSDLWELRTDDLGFAAADATILLNGVLKLDLAPEDIAVLSERTEGWAAGLYLVALSLMGRADTHAFIKDFAGDNRHIVDYLSAEVLDGSDLRWFLVCSSNLNKLSGPLCDAVLENLRLGGDPREDRARKPILGAVGLGAPLVPVSPLVLRVAPQRAEAHGA